ncbi:MAG: YqgE/AlgH family protein [Bacteroidales bacterium]|nr:YqgE/AlgH family protein [Bacteroidales bacterium]
MKIKPDIFKIKHNNVSPKQGLVLVSEPFAPDSVFSRSVILLAEHNEEGTVGFIINKPIKRTLRQITKEFGNIDMKISIGGPVNNENIYFIHTYGKKIPGSIKIIDNLYWGGDFKVLQMLLESGTVDENKIRFFVGYSGWQKDQLKNEIKKDYWLVSDIDTKTVMHYDKEIWNKVVAKLDKRYSIWQYFPENPNLN